MTAYTEDQNVPKRRSPARATPSPTCPHAAPLAVVTHWREPKVP